MIMITVPVAHDRVPMNLVLILLTLGPMARLSDPSKGGASVVFKAMACLTGLSTLIQVEQIYICI